MKILRSFTFAHDNRLPRKKHCLCESLYSKLRATIITRRDKRCGAADGLGDGTVDDSTDGADGSADGDVVSDSGPVVNPGPGGYRCCS